MRPEVVSPLQYLPLDQLKPSALNPRKTFDAAKLDELAQSFKGVGVIEPLVARPVNGHFEIVCGDRRSRAAALAQLATVPVIVKELTDAQVLEIMVIENNQREDVNALEEAEGFRRLLETGYELDKLAERIGRSKKYIYDRIKLLDLVTPAKKLLLGGRFTPGHAILLARLKPEQQTTVMQHGLFQSEGRTLDDSDERQNDEPGFDDDEQDENFTGMKARSVKELERHIADHVRFDVKHAAAAAPLEFGELAHRVEAASLKPGRGKKVISITFGHFVNPDARTDGERTFGPRSFKFADGKPHEDGWRGKVTTAPRCEHAVLGVVVAGEKYGQAFEVCIARDKCQVHWKQEIADRAKNQQLREQGKDKQAKRNEESSEAKWIRQQEESRRLEKLREVAEDRAIAQAVDQVKELTPELLRVILSALLRSGDTGRDAFAKRFGVKISGWSTKPDQLRALTGRLLSQAIVFALLSSEASYGMDFPAAVKEFGVDFKKLEAAVAAEQHATKPAPAKSPAKAVQTSAKPKKHAKAKKVTKAKKGKR